MRIFAKNNSTQLEDDL